MQTRLDAIRPIFEAAAANDASGPESHEAVSYARLDGTSISNVKFVGAVACVLPGVPQKHLAPTQESSALKEPEQPLIEDCSRPAIPDFGTTAGNDRSDLVPALPKAPQPQAEYARTAEVQQIPTTASLLIVPVRDTSNVAEAAAPIAAAPAVVEPIVGVALPDLKPTAWPSLRLPAHAQRYMRPGFLYAALIPAVIAVNLGYESFSNTMRDWMSTKAGVVALQQQVAELKKVPAAAPVMTLAAPNLSVAPPPLPDRYTETSPLPPTRQVKAVSVARTSEQPTEVSAAKDDIPAAGEFTLATDDKKAPPSDFKLIGER